MRVDDVDPGCGCALRSENRRRFWQKCAVWRGDDVSRVGLLTDSHRSSGPLSVNAHAVSPTHARNHAFSIRLSIFLTEVANRNKLAMRTENIDV